MSFWPVVKRVVKDSDIVVVVLDVRMPDLSKNRALDEMIYRLKKRKIMVFNKIDLVSDNYLKEIMNKHKSAFFVSSSGNKGISKLRRGILIMAKILKIENPKVGVVGYPNVGKSSLINVLAKRAKAGVSSNAGYTKNIQWVRAGKLLVLDSPGVVPMEDNAIKLGVLGSKNPDKFRDIDKVAHEIIEMFFQHNKKSLEDFYEVREYEDSYDFLIKVGEKRKFLLKGGIVDERRTAMLIVRDWQKGKMKI